MAESTKTRREALDEIRGQIAAKQAAAQEIVDRANGEGRNYTEEETASLKQILKTDIPALVRDQTSLAEQEQLTSEFAGLKSVLGQATLPAPLGAQPESRGDALALGMKSWGEAFTEDPAIKQWFGSIKHGDRVPEKMELKSPQFRFDSSVKGKGQEASMKALVTGLSATSAGALFQNQFLGLLDPDGVYRRQLTLMDLVLRIPVTSDVIEYPRIGTPTNAAAPVAEATATSGSSGAKPESSFPLAAVTETIRNIAHWIPVTRRALADAPMVRELIDSFLRYGLMEEMEDQMITGDGTGENFTGILNTSGTQSQAFSNDLLETTRKAVTLVQVNGKTEPNGYVFHPNDWEDLDLLTDNEARYYFGGPREMGTPRLWGRPVVLNLGMTEGTAVLGNWRFSALFDREQTAMYVTDSHSDFFIRNLLVILAEARAAYGVIRPKAFVEIALS